MYYFDYYMNILMTDFLKNFQRIPNTFRRFTKMFQKLSEARQTFPKISEEEPMMFGSYSNTSKYLLRDYGTIAMVIFPPVGITCYFYV